MGASSLLEDCETSADIDGADIDGIARLHKHRSLTRQLEADARIARQCADRKRPVPMKLWKKVSFGKIFAGLFRWRAPAGFISSAHFAGPGRQGVGRPISQSSWPERHQGVHAFPACPPGIGRNPCASRPGDPANRPEAPKPRSPDAPMPTTCEFAVQMRAPAGFTTQGVSGGFRYPSHRFVPSAKLTASFASKPTRRGTRPIIVKPILPAASPTVKFYRGMPRRCPPNRVNSSSSVPTTDRTRDRTNRQIRTGVAWWNWAWDAKRKAQPMIVLHNSSRCGTAPARLAEIPAGGTGPVHPGGGRQDRMPMARP